MYIPAVLSEFVEINFYYYYYCQSLVYQARKGDVNSTKSMFF